MMQTAKGSYHNLHALACGETAPGPATLGATGLASRTSRLHSETHSSVAPPKPTRLIIACNHLPIRVKRGTSGWEFEWDDDALVAQAKEGIPNDPPLDILFVGSLPVDIDPDDQDMIAADLKRLYRCCPVYLDHDLKEKYYKGFCKQQLWPLFHYILPVSPSSCGRFNADLWQAYVRANKCFADKIVEESASDSDFVWIHDYHLLVLPSLLRKRFNRIRAGVFLHCPFPSSEIFRTFPKREELLRSLLNADLIGFHTFDYARHFLSCCSRMLGLEHETSRGSITLDYYGRTVGIKIMPTGVNPQRYLDGFAWNEFKWRRGELQAQFAGCSVLVGVDDMDMFKGIELKLAAFERLLDQNPNLRGKVVLVQVTNPPRSTGREVLELHRAVAALVEAINTKYAKPSAKYLPVHYLERHVPLHERMAFYSVADCAVVTATRDGMNLVPYEYVVCRQGPPEDDGGLADLSAPPSSGLPASAAGLSPEPGTSSDGHRVQPVVSTAGAAAAAGGTVEPAASAGAEGQQRLRDSMLVVSEFVGCSPSLSGAIRVNPWSLESVCNGMYAAVHLPLEQRQLRHQKHWRYVSQHTVAYWASSYITDLMRVTRNHVAMRCYGLGLGLDTFRMVALDANFRKLEEAAVTASYASSRARVLLLDYDGTLTPSSQHAISLAPDDQVLTVLRALTADPDNRVVLFSGRPKAELTEWFASVPHLGLVAENGFWLHPAGPPPPQPPAPQLPPSTLQGHSRPSDSTAVPGGWEAAVSHADFSWKKIALPILQQYQESTDGSSIEAKESALVWYYKDADPDFGSWQAKELLDHLEGVLSNKPVEIVGSNQAVEIKPQGVSKGQAVERLMLAMAASGHGQRDARSPRAPATQPQPPLSPASGVGRGTGASELLATAGPDFVLCVGNDRSDEDMFTSIEAMRVSPRMMSCEVYACTVGQKPSRAPFYLNDPAEVRHLLARLVGIHLPNSPIYS
ncbi:trehalose-6-phosphate synthase/phosphatase [Haematococcus lacustris]